MILYEKSAISTDDVTIITQYSDLKSRSEVDITTPNHTYPFIASPMWHLGTKDMCKFFAMQNNSPYVLHRYFKSVEEQYAAYYEMTMGYNELNFNIFLAVGQDTNWIKYLIDKGIKNFCVDMANGNSLQAASSVEFIQNKCANAIIMAGNIETFDGYARLADYGATYFRVGIAGGSICSTNINTGNGLPILTALDNIYSKMSYSEKQNHFLIADGGMRNAGDIAKALAFGASYAMCGKLFASTNLAAGPFYGRDNCIELNKKKNNFYEKKPLYGTGFEDIKVIPSFVQYAGMASKMMREKANGSQSTGVSEEGMAGLIEYTGNTEDVFEGLKMNLCASIAYSGCRSIEEFRKNVIIQKISMGGKREKQIHLAKVF